MTTNDVCKICAEPAGLFARIPTARVFPTAGDLPPTIDYVRCGSCGFLFTQFIDQWPDARTAELIYHAGFHQVSEEANQIGAAGLASLTPRRDIRVLDYGCGGGSFGEGLRRAGFTDVAGYDPFVERFQARPTGRFGLVFAQEVLEHQADPHAGIRDILSFLDPAGWLLFTTLVQPPDIEQLRERWWYLTPGTGHVSLHTPASLRALLGGHGLAYVQISDTLHAAGRQAIG